MGGRSHESKLSARHGLPAFFQHVFLLSSYVFLSLLVTL